MCTKGLEGGLQVREMLLHGVGVDQNVVYVGQGSGHVLEDQVHETSEGGGAAPQSLRRHLPLEAAHARQAERRCRAGLLVELHLPKGRRSIECGEELAAIGPHLREALVGRADGVVGRAGGPIDESVVQNASVCVVLLADTKQGRIIRTPGGLDEAYFEPHFGLFLDQADVFLRQAEVSPPNRLL